MYNQPEPGAPGGDPDYHGAGGGGIGQLCDIGGPVAVLCGRIQFVDGFGRSGAFSMLERLAYLSSQPSGYRNHRRELVTNSDIYGDGRPPANARYGTGRFNESYLLGYETWTTAIYSNRNFAGFVVQTQDKYSSLHDAPNSAYSDKEAEDLKERVNDALSETCEKKLNELLVKLKSKVTDIGDLINNAFSGKGINLALTKNPIDFIYTKGFWFGADERIEFARAGETVNRKSIVINRKFFGQEYEVITFIHELFHTAKKSSHRKIANAIAKIEKLEDTFRDHMDGLGSDEKQDVESSNFINGWIQKHCNIGDSGIWDRNLTRIGAK